MSSGACQRNVPSGIQVKWVGYTKTCGQSIGLTRDRRATDAVYFRLHFALTKIGYDAARIIVDEYVRRLM
jgi:hypothetical protein